MGYSIRVDHTDGYSYRFTEWYFYLFYQITITEKLFIATPGLSKSESHLLLRVLRAIWEGILCLALASSATHSLHQTSTIMLDQ